MNSSGSIDTSSPAVQAHLSMEQNVIQRMAGNSSSCKGWAITLVSAILVVVADKGKPTLAFLAIPPVLLFFALDAYYLSLERMFRDSYKAFLVKLHAGDVKPDDLFVIKPKGEQFLQFLQSMISFSTFPFYGTLMFTVIIVRYAVL